MEVSIGIGDADVTGCPIEVSIEVASGCETLVTFGDLSLRLEDEAFERLSKAILRHWFGLGDDRAIENDPVDLVAMVRAWTS